MSSDFKRNKSGDSYTEWHKDLASIAKEQNISIEALEVYALRDYWAMGLDVEVVVTMFTADNLIEEVPDIDFSDDFPGYGSDLEPWQLNKRK
jgi:hypothetical protein